MDRKDWALLVITAAKERPLSPVQLQKSLFLLSQELTAQEKQCAHFYEFVPYDYGPFASEIYSDAELLEAEGQAKIVRPHNSYRQYQLTPEGLERAEALRATLSPSALSYLDKVVDWVQQLSFDALVKAIYKAYPEMKANSVFRD